VKTNLRGKQIFYFLKSVKTPNIFTMRDTNAFIRTFAWHKVNLLSSSSVILFFTTWSQWKIVITNLRWMRKIYLQIIWLHFSNNLEILLVNVFVPSNFCMTQSQSSVIKFCSSVFLPPGLKSVIATPGGAMRPPNIFTRRGH